MKARLARDPRQDPGVQPSKVQAQTTTGQAPAGKSQASSGKSQGSGARR